MDWSTVSPTTEGWYWRIDHSGVPRLGYVSGFAFTVKGRWHLRWTPYEHLGDPEHSVPFKAAAWWYGPLPACPLPPRLDKAAWEETGAAAVARRRIADYLAAHGPAAPAVIAAALGLTRSAVYRLTHAHRWFTSAGAGRWRQTRLTGTGEAAVGGAGMSCAC